MDKLLIEDIEDYLTGSANGYGEAAEAEYLLTQALIELKKKEQTK